MKHFTHLNLVSLCSLIVCATASAQLPHFGGDEGVKRVEERSSVHRDSKSDGKADAKADSSSSKSSTGETKTFRRVVKDGVVVEESGDSADFDRLLKDFDLKKIGNLEVPDADAMLRELKGKIGKDFPDCAKSDAGKSSSSSSSSHSRRVVVVNGKTVVDEECRDSKPVVPGKGLDPCGEIPLGDSFDWERFEASMKDRKDAKAADTKKVESVPVKPLLPRPTSSDSVGAVKAKPIVR